MAANVESMFYTRTAPWHGLGVRVEEVLGSKEALIQAGLDWKVEQTDVYIKPLIKIVFLEEMKHDNPQIKLTVPLTEEFLGDELLYVYLYKNLNMDISQIIMFDTSNVVNKINCHNLKNFKQVLSISLASKRNYHPYYYYENTSTAQYINPFPYYILTHDCVLCLSRDCNHAMILTATDQLAFYNKHFGELLKECSNLIHYTSDPLKILDTYDNCTDKNGFYMAMHQPCFGCFYTKDIINHFVRKELPFYDELIKTAYRRFQKLCEAQNFYTFFTEEGFKHFYETGQFDDFPADLVKPFPIEMRKTLIQKFIHSIKTGKITTGLMKADAFPDYLSLTTSNESDIGIFTTAQFPIQNGFSSIEIKEPGLCKAFHDWLLHLPDSNEVLSPETTIEIPKNYI